MQVMIINVSVTCFRDNKSLTSGREQSSAPFKCWTPTDLNLKKCTQKTLILGGMKPAKTSSDAPM